MMNIKNKTYGFSLIEIILTIAISMTFILIAFVLFQKVNESSKVETEVKNIATLRTNLKSLYYGKNLVAEQELNNVLINADLVPESMLNGDKETIINGWGEDVRVGTYYIKTGVPLLSLQYNNVPSSACIKLVSQTASSNEQVVVGISPGLTTTIVRDGSNRDVVFGTKKNDIVKIYQWI